MLSCGHMVNAALQVQLLYGRCGCRMGSEDKGMCWFQMLVTEMGGVTPGCTMFDVEVRRVHIELVRIIWGLRRTSEVYSDMGDTVILIVRKGCLVFALVVQQNHQGNPTQPLSPWEGLKSSYGGEVLAAHVLTLAIHTPFT